MDGKGNRNARNKKREKERENWKRKRLLCVPKGRQQDSNRSGLGGARGWKTNLLEFQRQPFSDFLRCSNFINFSCPVRGDFLTKVAQERSTGQRLSICVLTPLDRDPVGTTTHRVKSRRIFTPESGWEFTTRRCSIAASRMMNSESESVKVCTHGTL